MSSTNSETTSCQYPASAQSNQIGWQRGGTGLETLPNMAGGRLLPTSNLPTPQVAEMRGWTLLTTTNLNPDSLQVDDRRDLVEVLEAMHHAAQPCTKRDIAGHIEKLANHYPNTPRDAQALKLYVADWMDDLKHIPEDVLAAACVLWRRSTERFMPTPGQLLAKCDEILRWRTFFIGRAERLLRHKPGKP